MEKDGDRLTMFKQLPFHVGVKCLEQSVLEVDEAVRDFASNVPNPNPLNLSSWKFPQVKLEKLEVGLILRTLQNQNLPGEVHYIHLAELLIDRLYFSILSSIRFVTLLTNIAADDSDLSRHSISGDDNNSSQRHCLGLSVVNPLCPDSKVFNTNMALVIRHLQTLFNDLESLVHNLVAKSRKFELISLKIEEKVTGNLCKPDPILRRTRSCLTQTDLTSIECCEVCSMSQDAMKKVGETLEDCLLRISPKEQPAIGGARVEISRNIYNATQWSAVSRWVDALGVDAEVMGRLTLDNSKRNVDLEQELKKTTHVLNTNTRDHQLAIQKLEKKVSALDTQVLIRKKEKMEAAEHQKSLEQRIRNLQEKLATREEELKKETTEKDTVKQTLGALEKVHAELKYSQTTHSQTLRRIQQDLIEEQKHKETVQGNLLALESSNRKYRLEITNLRSDLELQRNKSEKLEEDVDKVKEELINVKDVAKKQNISGIETMKKEFKMAEQKIELLTLYPDLNGPINTPESENEDVLKTMENQLRGNTLRVQVLLQQSEKLAATLKKFKEFKK